MVSLLAGNSPMLQGLRLFVSLTLSTNGGSGFQQQLTIDSDIYSTLGNSTISNVFFADNTSLINSWLESGETNTSTATIYWIVLPNATDTVYQLIYDLSFANHKNNTTTGAEPAYTSNYSEYDNGANVFNVYENFAGTTINSGFTEITSGTGTLSQNNGITVTTTSGASSDYAGLFWTAALTPPFIFESDITAVTLSGGIGIFNTASASSQGYFFDTQSASSVGGAVIDAGFQTAPDPTVAISTGIAGGLGWNSSAQTWYSDYIASSGTQTYAGNPSTENIFIGILGNSGSSSSVSANWIRSRAYPPNGVMPSVTIGQIEVYPILTT